MWVLTKESTGLMWLVIDGEDHDHFILPIFTTTESAMDFVGDIVHNDELVIMRHIASSELIKDLGEAIADKPATAIVLDPPDPDTLTGDDELVYWSGPEFCEILMPLIEMSITYDDKHIVEVLDRYLNSKTLVNPK
jgi:hypothetical protein